MTELVYQTEQLILDMASDFVEPVGKRSTHTASRLAVLKDGTTMPVLQLLAIRKFKKWDEDRLPFWIDGDRRNELLSNVGLATRRSGKTGRRVARSSLGVPAGTREYMAAWRLKNKDRVQQAQERYRERKAKVLAAAREALSDDAVLRRLAEASSSEPKDPE